MNSARMIRGSKGHAEDRRVAVPGMSHNVRGARLRQTSDRPQFDVTLATFRIHDATKHRAHPFQHLRERMQCHLDRERKRYFTSATRHPRGEPVAHRWSELSPDIIKHGSWRPPNDGVPRSIARLDVPVARFFIMTGWVPGHRIRPAFVPENSKRHFPASLVRLSHHHRRWNE